MLGASCSSEILELVQTKSRNPEETGQGPVSASSKDGIKTMLKVFNCFVQKGVILTPLFKWEVGLMLTPYL